MLDLDSVHLIVRSAEPDEDWSYCYLDDTAFVFARADIEPARR